MSAQVYHSATITTRTGQLWHNGVQIRSSDPLLLAELSDVVHGFAQHAKIEDHGEGQVSISHLDGRDVQFAEHLKTLLLARGWEVVSDTPSEHHWYLELWHSAIGVAPAPFLAEPMPDIAGQLRELADLHRSGEISDTEYDAAKHRLLGL